MTLLAESEMHSVDDGWAWDDFLSGVSVGLAAGAIAVATGGTGRVVDGAIIAWTGVAVAALNLYL